MTEQSASDLSLITAAIARYAFTYQPMGFAKGGAVAATVKTWNSQRRDIYFLPAEPKSDASFTTTPKKEMLAGSRMVWADMIPPASVWDKDKRAESIPGALDDWLRTTEEIAYGFTPAPSCIIRSGRGLWIIWYLDELVQSEIVENINRWLRDELSGDPAAININHVARMPGTRNSKTGRMAEIVFDAPDRVYQVADFQQIEANSKPRGAAGLDGKAIPTKAVTDLGAFAENYKLKPLVTNVITHGHDPADPQRWQSRSEAVWMVCCELARAGVPEDEQLGVLLDTANGISASFYVRADGKPVSDPVRAALRRIRQAADEVDTSPTTIQPKNGLDTARSFSRRKHPHLIRHDELWLTYDKRGCYDELKNDTVLAELALWLETCLQFSGKEKQLVQVVPSRQLVNETFDMLKRVVHVPAERHKLPCWREDGPNPHEIVSCANGLFHMPSGVLYEHSADFLTRNALPCAFDPEAGCPLWLEKLAEWFPGQKKEIELLQEWFGLMLVADTSYQKALMIIGPKRSGKGTISRTLTSLVGERNVANPGISDLNGRFGLEPMVGKLLALISDGRIGHDTDLSALSENLLRVVGEDAVNVDRKGIPALSNVRLQTRIMITANELPRFSDDTGVIASRFMPIIMHQSFYNSEDRTLKKRLPAELSGILNWAIEGWKRLTARGYFELPDESRYAIADIEENSSPVKSWANERCELDDSLFTPTVELYADYKNWCVDQGRRPLAMNTFAQKLRAAAQVEQNRPRQSNGERPTGYRGISLVGGMQANERLLEEALREWEDNRCQGITDDYADYRDHPCNGVSCRRMDGLCPARAKFGWTVEGQKRFRSGVKGDDDLF